MSATLQKSVSNIFWAFLSFGATKILNLVAIIILARLLTPAEVGLMAFCLVIMAYFEILSRFGLGAALISSGQDEKTIADTADAVFTLSMLFSTFMAVLAYLTAPALAQFMEQPQLAPMLRLLCIAMIIQALGTVNNALLQKGLRFKKKIVPDSLRGLLKAVVSISLALSGWGVWSLVLGYLAGAIAYCLALWMVEPWRPRALPKWPAIQTVLRYGSALIGAETVNSLNRNLPMLLIGKLLGPTALGIFNLAYRIPELVIRSFSIVASSVTHPIMSEMRGDQASLQQYFYGCLRYFSVLTFPGGAAIAVMTPALVVVLYSPVWYEMIRPMQFLALAFAFATVNILPGAIYKAISQTNLMLRVSLINLPITVAAFWFAVPHGITAVAKTEMVLVVIAFVPNLYYLRRSIGIRVTQTCRCVTPGIFSAAVTAGAGSLSYLMFSTPITQLCASIGLMAVAYPLSLALFAPEALSTVMNVVRAKRRATS